MARFRLCVYVTITGLTPVKAMYGIAMDIHIRLAFQHLPRDQSNNRHHTLMACHTLRTVKAVHVP